MTDDQAQPTPKQREEREDAVRRLKAFIRKHAPGGCLRLSKGDHCRCPLCDVERLRTHSPEEPPNIPKCPWCGETLPVGRHVGDCSEKPSPEEPVGEEEVVALAKSYGYVVIHRSAWEFMRDDPHPERRNWNSPIGFPLATQADAGTEGT